LRKGGFSGLAEVKTVKTLYPSVKSRSGSAAKAIDVTQKVPPPGRTLPPRGILVNSKTSNTCQAERYSNRWKACGSYAHLAAANSMHTQRRISEIRQMMQEKYNRQLSGNLYQAYRKMAHYSNAVDPHGKCVYPHNLALFVGELGVPITEKDACLLLHREVSAKSLDQPFGMATFHAVATGKSLRRSRSFT